MVLRCCCGSLAHPQIHAHNFGGGGGARYRDLSRFRWNSFSFGILILAVELSEVKPWTDAIRGLRRRVSKYTTRLLLQGSRAPRMEFGSSEGLEVQS